MADETPSESQKPSGSQSEVFKFLDTLDIDSLTLGDIKKLKNPVLRKALLGIVSGGLQRSNPDHQEVIFGQFGQFGQFSQMVV